MDIFPLGTVSASSSQGTIDGISYSLFEPNLSCKSNPIYNILIEKFEQQTMNTRKKSEPILSFVYEYNNIFDREYRQIEHFLSNKEESLNSFYLIDFSKPFTPSSIADSGGDWIVSIDDTRLFSSLSNYKANHVVVWDGLNWKEGQITSVSDNTSVTVDVDTNDYGALTLANAQSRGVLYPLYKVYATSGALSNFKSVVYVDENINTSDDGGWMKSGSVNFIGKYKV